MVCFLVDMSVCVTFLFLLVVSSVMSTNSSQFVQEEMCDVEESIRRGCSIEVHEARNSIDCTSRCWRNTECVGVSQSVQGRCLHHQLCHTSVPCPGPDAIKHRYMARYCVHGTWNSSTHSCICRYGTFGERCNKYHKFCDSLLQFGYASGSHQVILDPLEDGANLIKALCTINHPKFVSVRLMVNSGGLDFNRTWNEYVNGFSLDNENIWMGLRAATVLQKIGVKELTVVLRFKYGNVNSKYKNFRIDGSEDNGFHFHGIYYYRARIGNPPSGIKALDCLSSLQGAPFSTWDRDQDGTTGENCASLAGSGWWYKGGNCDNPCQMLGWGLDNYEATPPRQRLTFLGTDVAQYPSLILRAEMYLERK